MLLEHDHMKCEEIWTLSGGPEWTKGISCRRGLRNQEMLSRMGLGMLRYFSRSIATILHQYSGAWIDGMRGSRLFFAFVLRRLTIGSHSSRRLG